MIDIHSHILPAVDDGVEDIETSVAVAESAVRDGLSGIVATPHFMEEGYRMSVEEIKEKVGELQEVLDERSIPLKIYPGAEVFIYPDLPRDLDKGDVPTINDSRYILLELPMRQIPIYTDQILYDIKVMGYQPVICHPERYRQIIEDPNILYNWVKEGIYAQVNASSLIGIFGERIQQIAEILVRNNLVQLIGSDLHSLNRRNECLYQGMEKIRSLIGDKRADSFLRNNRSLIEDNEFQSGEPQYYQQKKGLINKLRNFLK